MHCYHCFSANNIITSDQLQPGRSLLVNMTWSQRNELTSFVYVHSGILALLACYVIFSQLMWN